MADRTGGVIVLLLVAACRGAPPSPGAEQARSDSALTARTWGLAYLQQQQLPRAEAQFQKVVALAPDQALGYADLGLVYLREGRFPEAEAQLRRAFALDSSNNEIVLMLAEVYRLSGREADARHELERVSRSDSTDIRALYALARLAARSADPAERQRRESLLRRVLARAPANIVARLELVDLLLARGSAGAAAGELEALQRQLPRLPPEAARFFQRALVLARTGRAAEAANHATRFHRAMEVTATYQVALERLGGGSGAFVGYPVLTFNANMAVPTDDPRAVAAAIRFTDVTAGSGLEVVPALPESVATSLERAVALAVGDYDDDEAEDLFVAGHLFRGTLGRFVETSAGAGLAFQDRTNRPAAAAFGDFDNDGRLDLYVATTGRGVLLRNEGVGRFRGIAPAGLADSGSVARVLFSDLDHDGDLDLLLATGRGNRAYRNNLDGTFREMAAPMGLAMEGSRDAAAGDFDGDGRTDLVVVATDGRARLFRNLGQGRFDDVTAASGLAALQGAGAVTVGDYDNDGFLDLFFAALDGTDPALYHNRGDGTFERDARTSALRRKLSGIVGLDAAFFDFDNDGRLDLIIVGKPLGDPGASPRGQPLVPPRLTPGRRPGVSQGRGVFLFRNDATRGFEDYSSILPDSLRAGRAVAVADIDQDGDLDLIVAGWDGRPRVLRNDGGNVNQYVDVRLVALRQGSGKNNGFGLGATVELRARDLYQLRLATDRVTHFGLGRRLKADVLRIRWPNGVSQTVYYPGTEADVLEQQQLKGSCPFLYAWDGSAFTFVTDAMWNSALGMPLGIMTREGGVLSASPHASQEYLRLAGSRLRPRDGRYELRLTEELWETGYLDEASLLAVDHPESVQVYVNERFVPAGGGAASLRLYQVARPRPPVAAADELGNDLLPALRAQDDVYAVPPALRPARYQGLTELHDLVLDFGTLAGMDSVFLFLTGWIYPTDASINFALSQSTALQVIPLQVQVRDPAGQWRTVIPDLGFPAGKSKTVIADLTGKFLSADRRVRVRTNMEIYWDRAFVAATASASPVTVTTLRPVAADLHYRGFSRMYRKGGRYGPQWYDYGMVSREPAWGPIVGAFTRYGDVLPLVDAADDRYVIFGPGDEVALQFDSAAAPPLASGWTRDFLIYTDAWLKDADLNTATGGTVEPLPFHAMSRYPYGGEQAFPSDQEHRRFEETYNTRRVDARRGGAVP